MKSIRSPILIACAVLVLFSLSTYATAVTISSISPSSMNCPNGGFVHISGYDFMPGAQVWISGGGTIIQATMETTTDSHEISCYLLLPSTAYEGLYTVFVQNPGEAEVSKEDAFEVIAVPVPTVRSIWPVYGYRGSTITVDIYGDFFMDDARVRLAYVDWIYGSDEKVLAQDHIRCNITIPDDAFLGNYSVSVTNPGTNAGGTMPEAFEVLSAPPRVDFVASPVIGHAPLTVQFTDLTTGNPTSWTWNIGELLNLHEQNPLYTYTVPGNYSVSLSIRTARSETAFNVKHDYITVGPPLWNGLIRVEAEDFEGGRNGLAYYDTTLGNSGGAYRTTDVDIRSIGPAGVARYAITDTEDGEWTRYMVRSYKTWTSAYPLSLRVHATGEEPKGRSIEVWVNDEHEPAARVNVPTTLDFAWANTSVRLLPGENTLRFVHHASSIAETELEFDYFALDPSWRIARFPLAMLAPLDLNFDGFYEDVNGNGRADFADIVLYFNYMDWVIDNEPVEPFDYNGNGRIDFADVVWLFNRL